LARSSATMLAVIAAIIELLDYEIAKSG